MRIWRKFYPIRAVPVLAALTWSVCAAQSLDSNGINFGWADFSGIWRLNVEKSRWGQGTRPGNVIIVIENHGAGIKYRGAVTYSSEDVRVFEFAGAFDDKPYRMSRSYGDGNIRLHRVDAYTFEATFITDNGRYSETTRTSISHDGKSLTRKVSVQSLDGNQSWTEVYEKS